MLNRTSAATPERVDMTQVRAEVKQALDLGLPHMVENLLAIIVHLTARIDELEMRADEGHVPTARQLADFYENPLLLPGDPYRVYSCSGYSLVHGLTP